ncbi:phosphate/phosphite/phosphonate ABC transporter substrate-binding protein [Vibrio atypicus]|uniref:phosphate/phosphite/phosphonate ABC transporter substrate-binding protein n=1 Tax=Vibrio atypicus TaxID=558271 RepID=UPI00135C7AAB|nr:phosphate/phosphite/phosphonate ABC transporter substrate-binding protein [Vibrio atypicus]
MKLRHLLIALMIYTPLSFAEVYTFGIVPQQSAKRLAAQWTPILDEISRQTGHTIVFSTAADIPTFEQRLKEGEYDFAYMNPYHYTVYSQNPGYRAMAKAKDKRLKGIIVVKKGSNITSASQLEGKTLAFPSPAAFAASILTRNYLTQASVEFEPEYVSSHDSVYLAVAKGFYPAGGGIYRTFNSLPDETKKLLTPIWETNGFTPHAIAAHPRVPQTIVEAVSLSFSQLGQTKETQNIIKPLRIQSFALAHDSDWDDVRELNINLLE